MQYYFVNLLVIIKLLFTIGKLIKIITYTFLFENLKFIRVQNY